MVGRVVLLFTLTGFALPAPYALAQATFSPNLEVGRPLVRNYSPLDYNGHQQNFEAVQDARGVMYFANGAGLLEYDGASWRMITIHVETRVYDLAVNASGTVFVGVENDFGYLAPDPQGRMHFVSLLPYLRGRPQESFKPYRIHATTEGIFFNMHTHLLRWDGTRFYTWLASTPFSASAQVEDRVFVGGAEGVLEVRGDSLQLLPGTEPLGNTFKLALRYDADRLLLGTARQLWLYDGQTLVPFLDATTLGIEVPFSALRRFEDGTLILGTLGAGIFHIDTEGQLLRVINEASGLRDDEVRGLYVDQNEGLWIALNDGLAWVDLQSPLTYFNPNDGLRGQPEIVLRHKGEIYCATSSGVFRLTPARPLRHSAQFEAVAGFNDFAYGLLSHEKGLLAISQTGVYQIEGLQATLIAEGKGYALEPWPGDPHAVLIGGLTGLSSIRYDALQRNWKRAETVGNFKKDVRVIVRAAPDELWLILLPGGLGRMIFPNTPGTPPQIEHFGPDQGLPPGELSVVPTADGALIQSPQGLFRFHEATRAFQPDSALGPAFAQGRKIMIDPIVTANGVWSSIKTDGSNATLHVVRFYGLDQGRYHTDTLAVLRQLPPIVAWDFHVDGSAPDAVAWIATAEGLYRYDPSRKRTRVLSDPLVRTVMIGDSMVFGGTLHGRLNPPTFKANHEGLRFSYALPFFDASAPPHYQVRLNGFDEGWSGWTLETWKDYTNLPGGNYHFRVRGRDVYGRISEEAGFSFTVRSPWYLSWWAYVLLVFLGGGIVGGVVQWRLAYLKQRTRLLERTVDERTQKIVEQNAQLAVQANQLRELDEAKTHFFANISHELRTPLTLIVGPLAQLYDKTDRSADPETHAQLGMMLRNGQRLQRLINQILDLTKLEAGGLMLDRRPHDLVAFVARHVGLYEGLAEYEEVTLSFQSTTPTRIVSFDAKQMEKVLANLLSNAIKFTDAGGQVAVTVDVTSSMAEIRVADTGVGIAIEKLPRIFDRFYQVEDSTTRPYEGTGIGLALVKELVDLHDGTVHAESEPGRGSTFTVRIPIPLDFEISGDGETAEPSGTEHKGSEELEDIETSVAALATPAPSEIQHPPFQADQTTVLVVEDNADMRAFVRSILEPEYRVLEAADGTEGLRLARKALPDLILADVMMPEMDGLTMSRALREDPTTGSIPIVLLTARAARADQVEGLETGADAYLSKPFDAEVLRLQVGNLIVRQQRLRGQLRQEPGMKESMPSPRSAFEAQVCEVIEQHLSDSQFSVEVLADKVALSRQQLYRRLRDEAKATPVAYIRQFRLERASQLLTERRGNVSEVAYAVGFNSLSYFTRCFHDHFEETPSAFLLRNDQGG